MCGSCLIICLKEAFILFSVVWYLLFPHIEWDFILFHYFSVWVSLKFDVSFMHKQLGSIYSRTSVTLQSSNFPLQVLCFLLISQFMHYILLLKELEKNLKSVTKNMATGRVQPLCSSLTPLSCDCLQSLGWN